MLHSGNILLSSRYSQTREHVFRHLSRGTQETHFSAREIYDSGGFTATRISFDGHVDRALHEIIHVSESRWRRFAGEVRAGRVERTSVFGEQVLHGSVIRNPNPNSAAADAIQNESQGTRPVEIRELSGERRHVGRTAPSLLRRSAQQRDRLRRITTLDLMYPAQSGFGSDKSHDRLGGHESDEPVAQEFRRFANGHYSQL